MRIFIVILISFFSYTQLQGGEVGDFQQVLDAAAKGMNEFLAKIPAGSEALYGFESREQFERATLGKPYQIVTLPDEFFDKTLSHEQVSLRYTNEWIVPVAVDGSYKTLLTVARLTDGYQVVALGASMLAYELAEHEKARPKSSRFGYLYRIYQFKSDFIMEQSASKSSLPEVYPLSSAIVWLQQPFKGYELGYILKEAKSKLIFE